MAGSQSRGRGKGRSHRERERKREAGKGGFWIRGTVRGAYVGRGRGKERGLSVIGASNVLTFEDGNMFLLR